MSHTSSISTIKIVDLAAFDQAINDLRAEGLNITVVENAVPKAYYQNQSGMDTPAKKVLKIEGAAYDVALYETGHGQHELRTDFWGGSVARALGADQSYVATIDRTTDEGREEAQMAQLGKLYQRYSRNAVMNTVVMSGGSCTEEIMPDGSIQLVVRQAA